MTPNDLITLALKQSGIVGVGQTPEAEDMNDALTLLNMMIGQWNRRRWLIYHLVDVPLVSTGAQSYTVGPGGLFSVARPDQIEAAYVRVDNVDFPLRIMDAREDYARVSLKGLLGFPTILFYDSDNPLGRVYPWPIPSAGQYEIHLVLKETLAGFAALNQAITLPAEYQEALLYNLAARLRPQYGLPPEPTITALARSALNTVRNANTEVPTLRMPAELVRGGWNVFSGGYN